MADFIVEKYPIKPGTLVVIHAEESRWDAIRVQLEGITDPKLIGTEVILLEPGERLDALDEEDLIRYGLRRI